MKYKFLLLSIWMVGSLNSEGQVLTQTIRGTVIDADTREPLIGAEVLIEGSDPLIGTVTDLDGQFLLEKVPVGRQTIQSHYLGYVSFRRDNLQLTSAKEYIIEIALRPGLDLAEIVVQAYERNEAVNELFVSSVRRLDSEELQYHAATANDPGRLVMGFPGVQPSRDTRSDIVIRGNASAGLLWRLEGIDILNPNHFARRGSSGGGITIFSASLLGSSDFSVGAFPAEYGNAFSGVFDMRFRNGNMHRQEHTFRAGILGLDLATEGPIVKNKTSYLANFRYSTLGILNAMGIHLVGPRTDNNFQDFAFKIHHQGKRSRFSFWGIGGNSRETFRAEDMPWMTYSDTKAYQFITRMGVIGASWNYLVDNKSFLQVNAGMMAQQVYFRDDTLSMQEQSFTVNEEDYITRQGTVHAFYKRTFNARFNMKLGAMATVSDFDFTHDRWDRTTDSYRRLIATRTPEGNHPEGTAALPVQLQPYVQLSYRPHYRWVLQAGSHVMHVRVGTPQTELEPRIAAKYHISSTNSLALSYGIHHRTPPQGMYYYLQDGQYPNRDLKLIRAQHLVVAFDQALGRNLNLRAETYWQEISQAPVGLDPARKYWALNEVQGFADQPLVSEGTGRNVGVDVFLEKYFDRGTFFILSTSVFRSTYRVPGDDTDYSTRYDSRYTLTFTGGKTWDLSANTFLEGGFRLLLNGGSPLMSVLPGFETVDGPNPIVDETRPFEERTRPYIRPDVRLALRSNRATYAYWLALDIQNVINRRNDDVIDFEFRPDIGQWGPRLQAPLTPILTFELHF